MITLQMIPEPVRGWRQYGYRFPGRDEYYGIINLNPFVRNHFILLKHGEPVLDIRQTNLWATILLSPLKILGMVRHIPRYHVFSPEGEIGRAVANFSVAAYSFIIHGDAYVLREHSHLVGSLTKNDRQIARYIWKREHKPWWAEGTSTSFEIESISEAELDMVLAFALLFYWFFYEGSTVDKVYFHDKYKYLAHWDDPNNG